MARAARVGDLIGKVVQEAGLGKGNKLEALERAWREAVGRQNAGETRLESYKGAVLTVSVSSSALAHELEVYFKRDLMARLREQARVALKDIRFKVRGAPRGSSDAQE